jgi:hypothetical protein
VIDLAANDGLLLTGLNVLFALGASINFLNAHSGALVALHTNTRSAIKQKKASAQRWIHLELLVTPLVIDLAADDRLLLAALDILLALGASIHLLNAHSGAFVALLTISNTANDHRIQTGLTLSF